MRRPAQVCQVPGCGADLSNLRSYFVRQHICEEHARADAVPDGRGGWLRFCQQCTKLEPVSAFEGLRRSCEASLQKRHLRRSGSAQRAKSATGSLAAMAAQAPPMMQQGGWSSGQLDLPQQLAHLGGIPPMPAPARLPHSASAATIAAAIQAAAAASAVPPLMPPPLPSAAGAPSGAPSAGGTWQQLGGERSKDRSSPCSTSSQQPAGTNRSTSEARGQRGSGDGVKQEEADGDPLAVLMAAAALPEAAADADGPVPISDFPALASVTMDSSGNPVLRHAAAHAHAQAAVAAPLGLGWPQQGTGGWQQHPASFGGAGSAAETRLGPYQLSGMSSKATVERHGAPPAVDVQQMVTALQLLQQLQDVIGALLVAQVQQQAQQAPAAPAAPAAGPPAAGMQHLLQHLLGGGGLARQQAPTPPPQQQQGGDSQAMLQLLQELSAQQQQQPSAAGPPANAALQGAGQGSEQQIHALLRRWAGALQHNVE